MTKNKMHQLKHLCLVIMAMALSAVSHAGLIYGLNATSIENNTVEAGGVTFRILRTIVPLADADLPIVYIVESLTRLDNLNRKYGQIMDSMHNANMQIEEAEKNISVIESKKEEKLLEIEDFTLRKEQLEGWKAKLQEKKNSLERMIEGKIVVSGITMNIIIALFTSILVFSALYRLVYRSKPVAEITKPEDNKDLA